MNFGFIILCPERNIGGLKNTIASIRHTYSECPRICIVGNDTTEVELAEMNSLCDTFMAGNTITSLINAGFKNSQANWNVVVFAGSWLRRNIHNKFSIFMKSEKDILFPVVDRKTNFCDGSLNGLIIHRGTFLEVGDFGTKATLEQIKVMWAIRAIEKKCIFKAIIGLRIN